MKLNEYSQEQNRMERYSIRQKEVFYRLKEDIIGGVLELGVEQSRVAKKYSSPQADRQRQGLTEWIYKPKTAINCSDAVYLYFKDNILVEYSWRE